MSEIGETTREANGGSARESSRESTARPSAEQGRPAYTAADTLTLARLPLAVAFPLVHSPGWRLAILAGAGITDLLDGPLARRFGSSRFGALLDPIADKLFMAAAFGVVAFSGLLDWYELVGVLLRDIIATVAFAVTLFSRRPRAIPARLGGKAVTVAQILTLLAFLVNSPYLRPMAWATAAIATYAIWDYVRVAPVQGRRVGS